MLLLRCSFPADSMSRSISFWPSTIATRSSSAWVALNSMRFIFFSPALCHGRGPRSSGARIDELLQKSVLVCITRGERKEDDFWFSSSGVCGFAAPSGASVLGGRRVEFVVRRARVIRLPSLFGSQASDVGLL